MSDQKYPDGEFAKVAVEIANRILFTIEQKSNIKREDYLKAVSEAVQALQGFRS